MATECAIDPKHVKRYLKHDSREKNDILYIFFCKKGQIGSHDSFFNRPKWKILMKMQDEHVGT